MEQVLKNTLIHKDDKLAINLLENREAGTKVYEVFIKLPKEGEDTTQYDLYRSFFEKLGFEFMETTHIKFNDVEQFTDDENCDYYFKFV